MGKQIIFLDDIKCPKCGGSLNFDGKNVWCSFVGDSSQGIQPCNYGMTEANNKTLKCLFADLKNDTIKLTVKNSVPGTKVVEEEADAINPSHYKDHPSGVECIDVTEHMNFNLGNAVKYIWRAGMKDDIVQDLEKARWYVDREIQRLTKQQDGEH